jgi:hypothetical protein
VFPKTFGRFLSLLFGLSVPILAAPSITVPTPYPDAIAVNSLVVVTIKAQIGTDPTLIRNSVNVVRLTPAAGQTLGVIGNLYDDGTHGDSVAGDGIFSGQISFTEPQIGAVELVISAAVRGSLLRIRSNTFSIAVVQPATDVDIIPQIQSQASQLYDTLLSQSGSTAARTAVIAFLLQQIGVSSAGLSSDGQTISIQYTNGIRGMISTAPNGTSGGARRSFAALPTKTKICPLPATTAASTSAMWTRNAIILAPFYDRFSPYDSSNIIGSDLGNVCVGATQPILNENVTIDILKTLTRYSIIALYTHGGIGFGANGEEIAVCTRIPFNSVTQNQYLDDFVNYRLQPMTVDGTPGTFISATASFFQHYANVEKFPSSIVFANACKTIGTDNAFNYTLRDAFLNNGASTYLGWKNAVSINFNGPTEQAYFDQLTNTSVPASERTTGSAFALLPNGTTDPTQQEGTYASLYIFGDQNKTICPTWSHFSLSGGSPSPNGTPPVYDPASNRMVAFGGYASGPCCTGLSDTWILTNANGTGGPPQWLQIFPGGAVPPGRVTHSAVYDQANNRMTIFGGGVGGCGVYCVLFNDVWVLSNANGIGGTPTWTQLFPLTPNGAPAPRSAHQAVYDPNTNRMTVFGGSNNGVMTIPNDTWVLTNANGLGGTPQWIPLSPAGGPPARRSGFISTYDPATNAMTVFGGCCPFLGDLWILTSANGIGSPTWQAISQTSPAPGTLSNWNQGYDHATNSLLFFGGSPSFGAFRNDVWVLKNANGIGATAWVNTIPNAVAGSPPAGAPLGTYDAMRKRLMIIPDAENLWVLQQ